MNQRELKNLLAAVQEGSLDIEGALERLRDLPFEDIGVAMIDHHRELRHGAPEIILGERKSGPQLEAIITTMAGRGGNILVTRLDAEKAAALCGLFPAAQYDSEARTLTLIQEEIIPRGRGPVAVVAAGTSDIPVAREATITLRMLGHQVDEVIDVGVAGIHRLFARAQILHRAAVVIVVAGMEGALPSVVGGMIKTPLIAVPTSVGYGTSFGGVAALLGMLNSCASGITVVNIDNGFGAAYAAHRINIQGSE